MSGDEELDRQLAVQGGVVGPEDHAHPAAGDLAQDAEPAEDVRDRDRSVAEHVPFGGAGVTRKLTVASGFRRSASVCSGVPSVTLRLGETRRSDRMPSPGRGPANELRILPESTRKAKDLFRRSKLDRFDCRRE